MWVIRVAPIVTALLWTLSFADRHYYNARYWDDDLRYWEADSEGLYDNDLLYTTKIPGNLNRTHDGCYQTMVNGSRQLICVGTEIFIQSYDISTVKKEMFRNRFIDSLEIYSCILKDFEEDAMAHLHALQYLKIEVTELNHVPVMAETDLRIINLAGNAIKMDTNNYRVFPLPSSVTNLVLANNSIHWIPEKFISGPHLRIVSLSYNQLKEVNPDIFGHLPRLQYLGLDGNLIKQLTANNFVPLWRMSAFKHINVSNNRLNYIHPATFQNMKHLMAIELHNNYLARIQPGVFHNLKELLHLDLHRNRLKHLTSNSFKNLPQLKELRLHTQDPPMVSIAHDAWKNIGNTLRYLFISENALTSFPHAVMENDFYPHLREILADDNKISNLTAYGREAYPEGQMDLHRRRGKTFKPFSTYPNLLLLDLDHNENTHVSGKDLCRMSKLEYLDLGDSHFNDRFIDGDAFACVRTLETIKLDDNYIEEIPKCFSEASLAPSLNTLYLDHNYISYITTGQLFNLRHLAYLFLNNNYLITIEDEALPKSLILADMMYNHFRFLDEFPFANLPKLDRLFLRGNMITLLPLRAFENTTSLSDLSLEDNTIPEIRKQHFHDLTDLWGLSLQNNDLGWIEDGTFANLKKMNNMRFFNNRLTKIPTGGSFQNLEIAGTLLNNNWITVISRGAFKNLRCTKIQLHDNPITTIEPFAFDKIVTEDLELYGMRQLRNIRPYSFHGVTLDSLAITGTRIASIPANTFVNINTRYMYLASNEIEEIAPSAFNNVTVTENLDLSFNRLTTIEHPLFVGGSDIRGTLDVSYNRLETIGKNALHNVNVQNFKASKNLLRDIPRVVLTKKLASLEIDHNKLSVLPAAATRGLKSLFLLELRSNDLEYLEPGVFDELKGLRQLYLSNNRLRTLPEDLFRNMKRLAHLSLDGNQMTHLHTMTNTRLGVLEASENPLRTIDDNAFKRLLKIRKLYLDQDNASLECSCGLVETVDATLGVNISGICGYDNKARGTVFRMQLGIQNFYRFVPPNLFGCSARNVTANVTSSTDITVRWSHPDHAYFDRFRRFNLNPSLRRMLSPPGITGKVVYNVKCTTPYAPDLVASVNSCIGTKKTCDKANIKTNTTQTVNTNATEIANSSVTDISTASVTSTVNDDTSVTSTVHDDTTTTATIHTTDKDSFTASTYPTTVNVTDIGPTNATTVNTTDVSNVTSVNDTEIVNELQVNFNASHGVRPGTTYECFIKLETNGSTSARSSAVVVSTPDDIVPPAPSNESITGIELHVMYHDFNISLRDFDNMEYILYTNVTYVDNPYGAWLAASDTPTNDTFSSWFRNDSNVNIAINGKLFFEEISPTQLRFWSSDFFPLDGQGFRSEYQRDCLGTYHNFGFTTALRMSFTFGGNELITVGGGEGLWVFINKVKLVEFTSSWKTPMPCFVIDLSMAASYSGGFVTVSTGELNNGSCTIPAKDNSWTSALELEVGINYHFDVFHAETKTCSSELLLVLENWGVNQGHNLPVDHSVDISEDAEPGYLVAAIDIADFFSGNRFDVTLYSGNEDGRFTIVDQEMQPSNRTIWIPEFTEVEDIEGNVYRFVECPGNATINATSVTAKATTNTSVNCDTTSRNVSLNGTVIGNATSLNGTAIGNVTSLNGTAIGNVTSLNGTAIGNATSLNGTAIGNATSLNGTAIGNVTGNASLSNNTTANTTDYVNTTKLSSCKRTVENFFINGTTMYIVLVDELDYEVVPEYYLQMSIVDVDKDIKGFVAVRIKVTDINDNCPVILSMETFIPQPTLQKDPILTIQSVDIDSGRNGDIRYIVSAITADPPINYNKHLDPRKDFYRNYTTLTIDVIAIDNGTIPRGTRTPLNITLSNSCVVDAEYKKIDIVFSFNGSSHELTLRIPKYYMFTYDCERLAGLSTGHIPDDWITASSALHYHRTRASRGRLHEKPKALGNVAGAWVAGSLDTDQYLQVDLRKPYRFRKVHIQGRADADEWVTSFKIWYDSGNNTWALYNDTDGNNTFNGSTDSSTVVVHTLDPVINAQRIRINPQTWHGNISLRAEFTGCSQDEQLYYDVHCLRCETSYYCLGDGERHMCGRCHDNSTTCDRDPTEHSFGLASECSPCPTGWSCVDGYASPCPLHHYNECYNGTCAGRCIQCEPGYACNNGTRTVCKPGTYSDGYKKLCSPCKPGTYQDLYGQATCKPCGPGHSTANYGRISCYRCPREQYSVVTACRSCKNAAECPCLDMNTCFHRDLCYNKGSGSYGCFPCPEGYIGDGNICTDIDECIEYDPCFQSRCINTDPGYQCLECPDGYTGTFEDAYSWVRHRRVFLYQNLERSNFSMQTCVDVDECAVDNGGCSPECHCVNTVGSFYCDTCIAGYLEFGGTECIWADFAASGNHGCSSKARAIYTGPGRYKCECKIGYAGNGIHCGLDTDNDGFPDTSLPCTDWGCSRDNCLTIPNSMQENPDNDNLGNPCDDDDDSDKIPDDEDNCPTVYNPDQLDTDGDRYGDACDTCVMKTGNQLDTDGDGLGDICDDDDDNDNTLDANDNCPLVKNDQADRDGDGVGNACDNCPRTANADQLDYTSNWLGDECDDHYDDQKDKDGDGIPNEMDNCLDHMNSDQIDSDGDSKGDACDHDIDNDGVYNEDDNCPWVINTDQLDADRNTVGDECQWDYDDDGVENELDTCPTNRDISQLSFTEHLVVQMYPGFPYPKATFRVNGSEIHQTTQTFNPTLLIGRQSYGDIEYQGTWYVQNTSSDHQFGCVFGYGSYSGYYSVQWTRNHKTIHYSETIWGVASVRGLHIKLVDLWYGPNYIRNVRAVWQSRYEYWHAKLIWHDPDMRPWEPEVAYRWHVTFKPTVGYINLKVYQGPHLLVDSGPLYDTFHTGGHVGVYQWGEFPMMTWSNLKVTCLEHQNKALYLNGVDDFVELDDISTLQMKESFTAEVWLKLDTSLNNGPHPIFCSVDNDVCLWVQHRKVLARYGEHEIITDRTIKANVWYNIIMRYSFPDMELSIFVTKKQWVKIEGVPPLNWSSTTNNMTMVLGKRGTEYLHGTIDEFRLYNVSIPNKVISEYIFLLTTKRPVRMRHGILYFRMEDSTNLTSLVNSGLLRSPTATRHGGKFVPSDQQTIQHKLQYYNRDYERHGKIQEY